jgi:hypothetical protein
MLYFALTPLLFGPTAGQMALGLRLRPIDGAFNPAALLARSVVILLPFELNHVGLFWGLDEAGAPTPALWYWVGAAYALAGVYIVSALLNREGRAFHDQMGGVVVRRALSRH